MSTETCHWLLPTLSVYLTPEGEMFQCLLEPGHADTHLVKLASNQFIIWEPLEVPCDDCGEYCECFSYGRVSITYAMERLFPEVSAVDG